MDEEEAREALHRTISQASEALDALNHAMENWLDATPDGIGHLDGAPAKDLFALMAKMLRRLGYWMDNYVKD